MKTTDYFDNFASVKHPEIQHEWIERVLANPVREQVQVNGRISLWGFVPEFGGRALRVIALEDKETVFNTFFDRNFLRRYQRKNQT